MINRKADITVGFYKTPTKNIVIQTVQRNRKNIMKPGSCFQFSD